jgi:purine-binding chemotaxis protein CheW
MPPQTALGAGIDMQKDDEAAAAASTGNGQYVTFSCGGRAYGVDIMSVREIRSWSPTTELPDQPDTGCGCLDIRGEVIQVYDLGAVLGGGRIQADHGNVVLIVAIGSQTVGILVDAVSDIIHVGADDMRPAPANGRAGPRVVAGVAMHDDRMVAILDLAPIVETL